MATLSDLKEVKEALDAGLVSQAEFDNVKRDYLRAKKKALEAKEEALELQKKERRAKEEALVVEKENLEVKKRELRAKKEALEANKELQKKELRAKEEALEANKEFQKRELIAKEAFQQRKSEADLRAYALESIVKHGASIMSEEQKADLVRDYAKMSGLDGVAENDARALKRQRSLAEERDAAPPQPPTPPAPAPAPVVAKQARPPRPGSFKRFRSMSALVKEKEAAAAASVDSLMSEDQKADLVRDYVKMSGLERLPADSAGAPGAEPASKGRKYRCSKCGQYKKGHICPFAKKPKGQAGAIAGGASAQAGTSGSVQQQQQGRMAQAQMSPHLLPHQQRAESDVPPSKRQRSSTGERNASPTQAEKKKEAVSAASEDRDYSDDDDYDEPKTAKRRRVRSISALMAEAAASKDSDYFHDNDCDDGEPTTKKNRKTEGRGRIHNWRKRQVLNGERTDGRLIWAKEKLPELGSKLAGRGKRRSERDIAWIRYAYLALMAQQPSLVDRALIQTLAKIFIMRPYGSESSVRKVLEGLIPSEKEAQEKVAAAAASKDSDYSHDNDCNNDEPTMMNTEGMRKSKAIRERQAHNEERTDRRLIWAKEKLPELGSKLAGRGKRRSERDIAWISYAYIALMAQQPSLEDAPLIQTLATIFIMRPYGTKYSVVEVLEGLIPSEREVQEKALWSEEEDKTFIQAHMKGKSMEEIASLLGRTEAGVCYRWEQAEKDGKVSKPLREYFKEIPKTVCRWSVDEDQTFIRAHKEGKTFKEIAAMLPGRSYGAVQARWREAKEGKSGTAALLAYAAEYCKDK